MRVDHVTPQAPVYRTNRDHGPQRLGGQPIQPVGLSQRPDPLANAPQAVRALSGPDAAQIQPPLPENLPPRPQTSQFDAYA